ncbi:MAG: CPBP family intramembrane metalloprotease [Spirochaetales bacterium]|nr:CPBP family intramembrane metalloprotease [Spirochaetales bacterium]
MGTKKYRRDALIEAGLLFSLFYLPGYLFSAGPPEPSAFDSLTYNFQIWVFLTPQILTVLYLIHRDENLGYRDFGIVRPGKKDIPFALFALAGTAGLAAALQLSISVFTGQSAGEEPLRQLTDRAMIFPVLISSILTGYSEELFFRSYLFKRLEILDKSLLPRMLPVNLIFAAGHLYEGIPGGINAFILGFYFSFLLVKKKNIHIPALIHGFYNFSALLLSLIL